MIISRTPYRISFFGGGTDYPAWYEQYGGNVLATAIDRYCYITCRYLPPFFEHKHRIVYSRIEDVHNIDDIIHPAVREGFRFMDVSHGLEIHHDGDLPKQTGLGTSSSFTVGLLNALYALRGEMTTPMQLTREAIHVERNMCGDRVGSQDQTTAAHGGLNVLTFAPNDNITVKPVTMATNDLQSFQDHLMLFFTGFSRISSTITGEQIENIPKTTTQLHTMSEMVTEGVDILTRQKDLRAFGALLHEGWQLKQSLSSKISNTALKDMYDTARKAGALGGKLCGAGGGGFFLFVVEPERQAAVKEALKNLLHVPFRFDHSGAQIIVYKPMTVEHDSRRC